MLFFRSLLFSILYHITVADPSVAVSHDAVCNVYYGRPVSSSCRRLMTQFRGQDLRFFGIYPDISGQKPSYVRDPVWRSRTMLPMVRSLSGCNVALLSIYQLSGTYTSMVTSPYSISSTESTPEITAVEGGILWKCTANEGTGGRGVGGFRRICMFISCLLSLPYPLSVSPPSLRETPRHCC